MANITNLIKNIREAVFGKDVRESIASAIEQTYHDAAERGNANIEVVDARGSYDTLKNRLDGDKSNLQAADSNLQSQINGLASGSPLVASSVSEMTDTSHIYVNTTDGHWYYYANTQWNDGGLYQSAGIQTDQTLSLQNESADAAITGNIIDKIKKSLITKYTILPATIEDGIVLMRNQSVYLAPNGKHSSYDVSQYINFKMKITGKSNNAGDDLKAYTLCGFFDASNDLIKTFGNQSNTVYNDLEVVVPPNAKTLIVNGMYINGQLPSAKIEEFESINEIYNTLTTLANNIVKFKYIPQNNEFRLYVPYFEINRAIVYVLKHKGGNNLFDFQGYYEISIANYLSDNLDTMVTMYESSSDTLGPYLMKVLNNPDGDYQSNHLQWCGGSHEYTNTGSGGTPTARESYFNITIDNNELDLTQTKIGYCSTIKITCVNYVQASNTKKEDGSGREVLKEKHILEWKNNKWNISTEFSPLENIVIHRFMGLQLIGVANYFTNVLFTNSSNRNINDGTVYNNSISKNNKSIIAYNTVPQNTKAYCLEMSLDENYDLGKRDFVIGEQGNLFGGYNESYGKAYFNLIGSRDMGDTDIYDNQLTFNANNKYEFKGTLECYPSTMNY